MFHRRDIWRIPREVRSHFQRCQGNLRQLKRSPRVRNPGSHESLLRDVHWNSPKRQPRTPAVEQWLDIAVYELTRMLWHFQSSCRCCMRTESTGASNRKPRRKKRTKKTLLWIQRITMRTFKSQKKKKAQQQWNKFNKFALLRMSSLRCSDERRSTCVQ